MVHPGEVVGPDRPGRRLIILGDTDDASPVASCASDVDLVVHGLASPVSLCTYACGTSLQRWCLLLYGVFCEYNAGAVRRCKAEEMWGHTSERTTHATKKGPARPYLVCCCIGSLLGRVLASAPSLVPSH